MGGSLQLSDEKKQIKNYWLDKKKEKEKSSPKDEDLKKFRVMPKAFFYPNM